MAEEKKVKVKPKPKETKKTLDVFNAMLSQKNPPSDFTVVKASCVCGRPLNLYLNRPDQRYIAWNAFCKDCRRHIQFAITDGPL